MQHDEQCHYGIRYYYCCCFFGIRQCVWHELQRWPLMRIPKEENHWDKGNLCSSIDRKLVKHSGWYWTGWPKNGTVSLQKNGKIPLPKKNTVPLTKKRYSTATKKAVQYRYKKTVHPATKKRYSTATKTNGIVLIPKNGTVLLPRSGNHSPPRWRLELGLRSPWRKRSYAHTPHTPVFLFSFPLIFVSMAYS